MQAKDVYNNLIDEYVDKAALVGQAFTTDASEVYNYIVRFTSVNTAAEAKIFAHAAENNGRVDLMALKDIYEVVGVHVINPVQADKLLTIFFR